LKMVLTPVGAEGVVVDAIAFNVETELWPNTECQKILAAYKLNVNHFRGQQTCQLLVEYIEPA